MFKAKTERIGKLAELFPDVIAELDRIFVAPTNIYIDWQNVIHWQDRLGWHIDAKRLKQFLDSFDAVEVVSLYTGTLDGDKKSHKNIEDFKEMDYRVETKPVKIMPYSIDASSVPANSPALLQPFIKKPFLSILNLETIEYLNSQLGNLNKQGILKIEDRKCNFDVEIGRDMFLNFAGDKTACFILWSGDSDFVDPVTAIMEAGKSVFLFATSGRVSAELSELNVPIFEIKKIKEFICWKKELPELIWSKIR
jgi:uncharacterized LabA/DUF88 family protein